MFKFISNTDWEDIEIYEFVASKYGIPLRIRDDATDSEGNFIGGWDYKAIDIHKDYPAYKFFGYIWAYEYLCENKPLEEACLRLADRYVSKDERRQRK